MTKPAAQAYLARIIKGLEVHSELDADARGALAPLPMRVETFQDGYEIVRQGEASKDCCLVLSGVAGRYKRSPGRPTPVFVRTPLG